MKDIPTTYQENTLKFKISFIILGIGGLGAWNAILSELTYFDKVFPGKNTNFYFPLFNYILNVVFQFYLVLRGNPLTYKSQVVFNMFLSIFILVGLPITSYIIKGQAAYVVTSILMVLQGFANSVLLSGLFGIVSFLPGKNMVYFSVGQAVAGILMNAIGFVVYGIFQGSEELKKQFEGALIYFIIIGLIIVMNIVVMFVIYKDRFFIYCLRKSGEFSQESLDEMQIFEIQTPEEEIIITESVEVNTSKTQDFITVFKTIPDLVAGMIFIYIGTFFVFPGACLNANLVENSQLNALILLIVFNSFDAIGRFSSTYFSISRGKIVALSFLRTIPIVLLVFVGRGGHYHEYPFFENKAVILIIYIIFAITNGYCTVLHFIYGPGALENRLKGKAGSFLSLSLVVGIFIGAMLATFVVANIVG